MRYQWTILDAGPLALDGGSMFGVVPKVLWEKSCPADEKNRIILRHNCLLLRPEGEGAPVLIETGSGDKFDARSRAIFGLSDRSILTALAEQKVKLEAFETVIVTHLHFDHAGGLTRRAREGETPDWADADGNGVMRTFPNARVHVHEREWEDAVANRSVMTRTYLASHLEPIHEHLKLAQNAPPLTDESIEQAMAEVEPGIRVFRVPGHTWGQQAVHFEDTQGRGVVFVPDVMPTVHHVGLAYSMAYDVEPYTTMQIKRWLLEQAATHRWTLVLDHEPKTPAVTVERDEERGFRLLPADAGSEAP